MVSDPKHQKSHHLQFVLLIVCSNALLIETHHSHASAHGPGVKDTGLRICGLEFQ